MNTYTNNLDTLRERIVWQHAEMMQKYDWIAQDRESRDPYGVRAGRLLDQSSTLLTVWHEISICMFGERR